MLGKVVISLGISFIVASYTTTALPAAEPEVTPLAVFEQRIMPIFASPNPSSCVQCHLASVDLKDYILPSSEATFQGLRKQGLVNVRAPRESKILKLIAMGEQDADAGAKMIHAKTRKAEYEAFAAWIEACCQDTELISASEGDAAVIGPTKPLEVVRHNRKDRLLDSFVRNVWSQRMRCFPCHTPHEIDIDNPLHEQPSKRHADYVAEYGQKMNLFLETPEQTLRTWITNSRKHRAEHLPMINIDNPPHSLLVLKPSAKLPPKGEDGKMMAPSSVLPVSHMGGLKIHVNDHSYKAFVAWIEDYAKVVRDEYQDATTLPKDNWLPTEHFLKILNAPEDWPALSTVQVFVFNWDSESKAWSSEPTAFTQSLVTPRHIVNGPLFLFASTAQKGYGLDSQDNKGVSVEMPSGKYLVRVCLDREHKVNEAPSLLLLNESANRWETEVEVEWKVGFKNAVSIDGGALQAMAGK